MSVHLLCVDLQNEFASPGGRLHRPRPCIPFLMDVVFPTARLRGWSVHEIRADYRDPAKTQEEWTCAPGSWAGTSLIPSDLLSTQPWFKATTSPAWIRHGGGEQDTPPGQARPAPEAFTRWLRAAVGPPRQEAAIVVVGLMLKVCVLSTIQELTYRAYRPHVLLEGVDTFAGTSQQKEHLADGLFPFWATPLTWEKLRNVP